jgi:hypothetical protein
MMEADEWWVGIMKYKKGVTWIINKIVCKDFPP